MRDRTPLFQIDPYRTFCSGGCCIDAGMGNGYFRIGALKHGPSILSFRYHESLRIAAAQFSRKLTGEMIAEQGSCNRFFAVQRSDPLPAHRVQMRLPELRINICRIYCTNFEQNVFHRSTLPNRKVNVKSVLIPKKI